jgi:beta-1,4-N-acetylglucosaminyltransferase
MQQKSKCVFVTVGSTKFDDLTRAVLSSEVLDALSDRGFNKLVLQCGHSATEGLVTGSPHASEWSWMDDTRGIEVLVWRFQPELGEHFKRADLVISHAGAYTSQLRTHGSLNLAQARERYLKSLGFQSR